MPAQSVSPRLFVFLAHRAAVGIILRRGPSAWAHLTLWDTDNDTFDHGQWVKARIYEDRCDVAPDGSLFLYFAHQGRAYKHGGFSAWTAISRPPYFTALAMWPQAGTYFGGGLFDDSGSVLLNGLGCEPGVEPGQPPRGLTARGIRGGFVQGWSYIQRLERDGWLVERAEAPPKNGWWSVARPPSVWRRAHPQGRHVLAMSYPGGTPDRSMGTLVGYTPDLPPGFGGYAVRFWVEVRNGDVIPLEGAAWADWDRRGRLVVAKDGRLFASHPERTGIGPLDELADFTSLRPDPQPAPEWARSWSSLSRRTKRRKKKLVAK